jgi:hypothetical protein
VFLHRGLGEDEALGDLGVGPALADGDQDLSFALGERPQPGILGLRGVGRCEDLVGVGVQQAPVSRGDTTASPVATAWMPP